MDDVGVGDDDVGASSGAEDDVGTAAADAVVASDESVATMGGLVELLPSPSDEHAPIERVATNIPEMSRDSRVGALNRFRAGASRPTNGSLAAPPAKDVTSAECPVRLLDASAFAGAEQRAHHGRSERAKRSLVLPRLSALFGARDADARCSASLLESRTAKYSLVSDALGRMSDGDLISHLRAAPVLGSGIGGVRQTIRVGDVPVFVKRIPLTDRERSNANVESTANLFDLPVGCQYGVGSPSFGVWREIAANTMATGWVRDGQAICHLLMYHWRVVDEQTPLGPLCYELADIDRFVEYWHGSAAVRQRAEAINSSTASVVLFLEYMPTTLPDWLRQQIARDDATANAAIEMVAEQLRVEVASMNNLGLFHFDAHLDNMLSDGGRIYIADFGLATSLEFDLSDVETQFIESNVSHDVAHTMTRLVDWLVTEFVTGADYYRRNDFVRACASGRADTATLPAAVRKVVNRYAALAVLINDFYLRLHLEDRNTPYPNRAIERACLNAGLVIPRPQPG